MHDRQHYELVDWRRGDAELNYRRFFAIADLAGLRVEDPEVFDATHAEILRWYAAGDVDGIRVDHPDGLRDPGGYLRGCATAAPDAWLVVEKILEPGEELPRLAGRRHHRLRRARRGLRRLRRPGRRGRRSTTLDTT